MNIQKTYYKNMEMNILEKNKEILKKLILL